LRPIMGKKQEHGGTAAGLLVSRDGDSRFEERTT